MNDNAYRACVGFDPTQKLSNGYLAIPERMRWFHQYLKETHATGLIDEGEVTPLEGTSLKVVKAAVFINGQLVGVSCSADFYKPYTSKEYACGGEPTVGQKAATQAKGRALANAGFGSVDAVMPPDLSSVQSAGCMGAYQDLFRPCSYDPRADLDFFQNDNNDPTAPKPFLRVPFRMRWFNQYLKDTHSTGYIDNSEVRYDKAAKLLVARAKVVINDQLVGTGVATYAYDPETSTWEYNPVDTVCTKAAGRALQNAGFGFMAFGELEDDDMDLGVCDAPIPVGEAPVAVIPSTVPAASRRRKPKAADEPKVAPTEPKPEAVADEKATATTAPAKVEEPVPAGVPHTMTQEEALKYVIPCGNFTGKTIGEAIGINRGAIAWFASDKFNNPQFAELKMAAAIALGLNKAAAHKPESEAPKAEAAAPETAPAVEDKPAEPSKPAKRARTRKAKEMTPEEGLAFVMPMGPFSGRSIGEIIQTRREIIEFYAGESFNNDKYPEVKAAAIAALKGVA